ncbi:MAG: fumarate hydratase [Pseudomonadota bacterium]
MPPLAQHFEELIRRASTVLPIDVQKALQKAAAAEGDTAAGATLRQMLDNAAQAKEASTPICQDTGTPIFYVDYGPDFRQKTITEAIKEAAAKATGKYYLRPNAVDPVTGKNSGNNVGVGFPYIHFHEMDESGIRARLMLKGGGSENVGAQYRLPDSLLKAGRDLEGVRRCAIDAVFQAQGKGCAPGTVSIGIGGDRGSSFVESKEQLFRPLDDTNPNKELAALEKRLYSELNELGIGPMGFGGKTTVLGVKIGTRHRVPASYFVSVSYVCWAYRRASMVLKGEEVSYA